MKNHHGKILLGTSLVGALFLFMGGCNKPTETSGSTAPASVAAADTSDSAISSAVKSTLMADPSLKIADLKVDTLKGVVQLGGTVDDQAQLDRATTVARGVNGVTSVENKLTLATAPAKS